MLEESDFTSNFLTFSGIVSMATNILKAEKWFAHVHDFTHMLRATTRKEEEKSYMESYH